MRHSSVVFDNKIWVIGGSFSPNPLNDVWSSTDGITWTEETASAEWGARISHRSVVFNNKIWRTGGDPNIDEVWYYGL